MILVDPIVRWPDARPRIKYWCHMVSTENVDELHGFALRIGCKRSWFQQGSRAHYDLSRSLREKALSFGAVEVSSRELVLRNFDRSERFDVR